ncbi:MAG: ABC transporter permease subunit [Verrucomicrobiota bacterium]|nr:ABC transporter permease [Verrucomicrobiota bacterium]
MNNVMAISGIVVKELYRRKDFYVLFVLTALITLLLGSVSFFNDAKIVRYLKEVCLLLIWISSLVIAIGTAARQIPAERESRTIFPLLAKPVTRGQFIMGKFLGCWLACGVALAVFYLFFGVVSESRGGRHSSSAELSSTAAAVGTEAANQVDDHDHAGDGSEHHDEHAVLGHRSVVLNYVQALWLHWMMLGVVTAMVLLGSVVLSAPSVSVTISFIGIVGILLLGEHLNKVALRQPQPLQAILYTGYFLIPHLEWFDIRDRVIYDQPPIPFADGGLATLYAIAYTGLFLFLTWFVFRRKALTL